MQELKDKMILSMDTIIDVVDKMREPIGNDFTYTMKFATENRILTNLKKLVQLASTPHELEILNDIFLEVSRSLQTEVRNIRRQLEN